MKAARSPVVAALAFAFAIALVASAARALDLGTLFSTPERRAAARLEAGEHEALIEDAPDARWEGFGRYAAGDHAGASEAFARALDEREAAGTLGATERDALRFERATAATRAGRLDEAIELYETLLEDDPEHADARHNLEIARALRALGEPPAHGGGGTEGEEGGEPSERGQGEEAGDGDAAASDEGGTEDGRGDRSDGRSAEEARSRDEEAGGEADGATDEEGGARGGEIEPGERAEEEAAARAALAAEPDEGGAGDEADAGSIEARAPSEREQATEQWLRRIDDDPAGLLRRRLERNHRDDYPEVGDGVEPW